MTLNRTGPLPVYVLMAVWMLLGAVYRMVVFLSHGYTVDVVPFVSVTIGVTALIVAGWQRQPHTVMYLLMTGWLPVGSILRVIIQLRAGEPLDPVPGVSLVLAFTALALYLLPERPRVGEDDGR